MSDNRYSGQYNGYGGNPYEQQQSSDAYGSSNPYGGSYARPPRQTNDLQPPTAPQHNPSSYTQDSTYSQPTPSVGGPYGAAPGTTAGNGLSAATGQNVQYVSASGATLSQPDFLARVEAVKADIRTLTTHVGQIASLHQRSLSSPDSGSVQLESMVTQTQVLNTSIKDQIKYLEADAVRSRDNNVKNTQIAQLKSSFQKQLQEYRVEEANYERSYREQIARQYRIVNPEATDAEVNEATQADWGNEGVFQTALKTNRSATANTVLGAVRARHNDVQKIERTLVELNRLMEDLATTVVLQEEPIRQAEMHTDHVKQDTEAGNKQLEKGIKSARNARKLKWWCFWICLAIIAILALVLGLYFGLRHN